MIFNKFFIQKTQMKVCLEMWNSVIAP